MISVNFPESKELPLLPLREVSADQKGTRRSLNEPARLTEWKIVSGNSEDRYPLAGVSKTFSPPIEERSKAMRQP